MKLCFATFTKIIGFSMTEISENKLVAILARCVDRGNSCIDNGSRFKDTVDNNKIQGNRSYVSKIMKCTKNFYMMGNVKVPTLSKVIKELNEGLIYLMGPKCKAQITLSLIRLIESDESIDDEEKGVFKSIFGMDIYPFLLQTDFVFSDFLARVLLYVTNKEIKNTDGKDSISMITEEFVEETVNAFKYAYSWNSDSETLTFYGYKILHCFENILNKNDIKFFMYKENPTVSLKMNYWDCKILNFHNDIENEICNVYNQMSNVVQKIIEFYNTLDDYFIYISYNVRPLDGKANLFVPNNNDSVQLMIPFKKKISKFLEKLDQIYKSMYELLLIQRTVF